MLGRVLVDKFNWGRLGCLVASGGGPVAVIGDGCRANDSLDEDDRSRFSFYVSLDRFEFNPVAPY
jgi:hypothetical protein